MPKFLFLLIAGICLVSCQQSSCPSAFMKPDHPAGLLRVSSESDPETVDPRKARNINTMTLLRMLYEGLVRAEPDGSIKPAIASSIDISADQTVYTFKLREAFWSNGEPVVADDFVYAWKTILSYGFAAPNAYQLYPLKGAQTAKEGTGFADAIGVFASNAKTLVIELEKPMPEFLQLLSTPIYFPVNSQWARDIDDETKFLNPLEVPYNGPFVLKNWNHQEELTAVKNSHYWDAENVKLQTVQWIMADNNTAMQLFSKDELDWTGSPLSTIPLDVLSALSKGCFETVPADGVFFLRVNTQNAPFDNVKVRQAFSLAVDRQSIVDYITQANQPPTAHLVPRSYGLNDSNNDLNYDPKRAVQMYQDGMAELELTKQGLPPITLCYSYNDRDHKIAQALQRQWKTVLGVDVTLPNCEMKMTLDNIRKGNYMLARGAWFADIHDPMNYLEVFKLKNNGTNNTGWENPKYVSLLNQASEAKDTDSRKKLLSQAEELLLEEAPIIPLFEGTFSYMKKPRVRDVFLSSLGYLDFKYAWIAQYVEVRK